MHDYHGTLVSPWVVGARAARENLVPGLILQLAALILLLSYYFLPGVAEFVEPVADLQRHYGPLASFVNRAFFAGILPGLFLLALPSLRTQTPWRSFFFGIVWWGMMGVYSGYFYHLQAVIYGNDHRLPTLLLKMLTDQLVYTPFFACPLNAVVHFWEAHGFSWKATVKAWPRRWVQHLLLPNLIPCWVLWVPGTMIVYSLPQPLQIQFSGLIGCFWALLCLRVGVHSTDSKPKENKR